MQAYRPTLRLCEIGQQHLSGHVVLSAEFPVVLVGIQAALSWWHGIVRTVPVLLPANAKGLWFSEAIQPAAPRHQTRELSGEGPGGTEAMRFRVGGGCWAAEILVAGAEP